MADIFRDRPERKFVNYHNITPADLLEAGCRPWATRSARPGPNASAWPRSPSSPSPTRASTSESCETPATGRRRPCRSLIDLDGFAGSPDPALADRLAAQKERGGTDLLFVGKVSPHKGQHDLVKALAAYRRLYDPEARLAPGGGSHQRRVPDWPWSVRRRSSVWPTSVEFAGSVTHEELIAYYDAADAFVCLSNHEGFCVPLLEAMHHRLPIVAYTNTAVPETVAGRRPGPARQGAGPGGRGHRPGGPRRSGCGPSWPRRRPSGSRTSPCPGSGRASPRPSRRPAPRELRWRRRARRARRRFRAMKVTFVVPRYGPAIIGGAETAARALCRAPGGRARVGRSRSSPAAPRTSSPGTTSSPPGPRRSTGSGWCGSPPPPAVTRRSTPSRRRCWPIRPAPRWPTPSDGSTCRGR